MPLAACLGLGDNRLYETMGSVSPFLLAQNLFYIGSRSVDEGEEVILAENNIRTIRMPQIQQNGIEACCREILQQINTPYIHLSFDVDFMDAAEFSATGLPIPDGSSHRADPPGAAGSLLRPAGLLGRFCRVQPQARPQRPGTAHLPVPDGKYLYQPCTKPPIKKWATEGNPSVARFLCAFCKTPTFILPS